MTPTLALPPSRRRFPVPIPLLSVPVDLRVLGISHVNGILQCGAFCVWLVSLSVMSSKPVCVVGQIHTSFLFRAN